MSPEDLVSNKVSPQNLMLSLRDSVRDALKALDANGKGIVLVTDAEGHLLGTVTDGDIRRFVLSRRNLNSSLADLLEHRRTSFQRERRPVTAHHSVHSEEALQIMRDHMVHQLPLLDDRGRVIDLLTMDEVLPPATLPVRAVIMAGGFGTRLGSLTATIPKPMLPIGGRPLMEVIVNRLQQSGIRRVNVTTHYLPDKIINHFGDGGKFGVRIQYVHEESPLGTAGALSLLSDHDSDDPLLVMNGDILTEVDFRAMHSFHRENGASMTVAVRAYEINVPYGVVESEECVIRRIVEKPNIEVFVNAGIYLLEAEVRRHIPVNERFDMPDLIRSLLTDGKKVVGFPILESWIDIGQPIDYQRAQDHHEGSMAA